MMTTVFLNGEFLPSDKATISVFDHGFLYGDGIYETLVVKNKEILDFTAHFIRLKNSAEKMKIFLPYTEKELFLFSQELLRRNSFLDARLRITLTRGNNSFSFLENKKSTCLITLSPLSHYSKDLYTQGVSLVTEKNNRVSPHIKSTSMLPSILLRQKMEEKNAFEAIFIDKNNILLEGSVSNIFAVLLKEKKVWITPKEKVLAGTMQKQMEQYFHEDGFKIEETEFTLEKIFEKDARLFISNSLFGVLPVKSIDERAVLVENSFARMA